jgi:hypothetical protein
MSGIARIEMRDLARPARGAHRKGHGTDRYLGDPDLPVAPTLEHHLVIAEVEDDGTGRIRHESDAASDHGNGRQV